MNEFFDADSAERSGFEPADVIVIRHVLEHIDDFAAIFAGIELLAKPDATLLIEVPDLTSTIEKSIYSNIYHLHPCYFEVETMSTLLSRHGWQTIGSTTVDIFGGSLLLWAQRKGTRAKEDDLPALSFSEVACHVARESTRAGLQDFVSAWKVTAQTTREFFDNLRDRGARVAGYGAAERTTSLMGVAGLDASHCSVVFDRNTNLVGKVLPGNRIPILNPDRISEHNPEYLVIFAQSFEDEIVDQLKSFRDRGGKFISLRSGHPEVLS